MVSLSACEDSATYKVEHADRDDHVAGRTTREPDYARGSGLDLDGGIR